MDLNLNPTTFLLPQVLLLAVFFPVKKVDTKI